MKGSIKHALAIVESGKLTLAHVKPVLDKWAQLAADFTASNMQHAPALAAMVELRPTRAGHR